MSFKEINIKDISESATELFGKRWALIGAGDENSSNIMTASWGTLGRLWNKDVAIIFVRPQRHTFGLIDKDELFTINFLDEQYRDALKICGEKSGKDYDKFELAKLNPYYVEGTTAVDESRYSIVCKKIAKTEMSPADFLDQAIEGFYPNKDYHYIFIGEIIKVLEK